MKKSIIIVLLLAGCSVDKNEYDASGTFEAVETIISAEASGVIQAFPVQEGEKLKAGQVVAHIDSTQLYLKKKQLEAQIKATLSRKPDAAAQISVLKEQLKQAEREQLRISNLVKAEAATQKQLDDVNAQTQVIKKQIAAQESSLNIATRSLDEESSPLVIQVAQYEDLLAGTKVINPVDGVVLVKYAEPGEMAASGKPLYKIADISFMTLRAYITGDQLPLIKLNQNVVVFVDSGDDTRRGYPGTIQWISDKAEFTPKTIQTKNERANLVYAVKIRVKNDGLIKIGMYGEVSFEKASDE
jgi:HlyD family secretion protein